MIIATKHAVNRYMERAGISKEKAFSNIINKLKPQERHLRDAISILGETRIDLGNNMKAICKMKGKDILVMTVRKCKWK